ncbi:MAG: intradiol ring-cleavage dioxygenase [Chloroflexota bacterium]
MTPNQSRRAFLWLGLSAPFVGLLAACGNAASTASPTLSAAQPPASQPPASAQPSASAASSAAASPAVSQAAASPAASQAAASPAASQAAAPALLSGAGCVLSPEQTEGPYYIDVGLLRGDVTEGRPGVPLQLHLTVQNANTCKALPSATVELWHCDAGGVYSGYGSQALGQPAGGAPAPKPGGPPPGGAKAGGHVNHTNNETFLRGGQVSDANGSVIFETIYPGWYMGRTTHIHVRVHAGGQIVHTGQLYMDDAVTDAVYTQQPYAAHGKRDLTNAKDGIYRDGGAQSMLALSKTGAGYTGALTLGVKV